MEGIPPGYSQQDILAALSKPKKSVDKLPFSEVQATLKDEGPSNGRKLYCPREGCSSVIIGAGGASLLEAEAGILPDEEAAPFPPPGNTTYWLVSGGPYAFDNIGFSRLAGVELPATAPGAGGKVKWLSCAECDLGPLGWTTEGGQDSWLAADRVKYGSK